MTCGAAEEGGGALAACARARGEPTTDSAWRLQRWAAVGKQGTRAVLGGGSGTGGLAAGCVGRGLAVAGRWL
jgi:hypothetical protein